MYLHCIELYKTGWPTYVTVTIFFHKTHIHNSPRDRNGFNQGVVRPKGLKVCSYEEKYSEFKNQTLKISAGTQKCYVQRNTTRGRQYLKIALKWGYHCRCIL